MATGKGPGGPHEKRDAFDAPWGAQPDLCQRIAADRMLQLEICCTLESIADSLPGVADLRLVRALTSVLEPSWTEHVSFQDDALFPILVRRHHSSQELSSAVERLRRDHLEIGDRNREVNEQFEMMLGGYEPEPEMFGYLLRNAFDGRRRHIESEIVLVEMYLPTMFTPAERAILDAWNVARPRPPFPLGLLLGIRH
jgi:hypothetical protein